MSNYSQVLKTMGRILVCGVALILIGFMGLWMYFEMMNLDVFLVNNSSHDHRFRLKVRGKIVGVEFVRSMTAKHLKLRNYPEGGLELSLDTNQYYCVNYVSKPYVDRPVCIIVKDGMPAEVLLIER